MVNQYFFYILDEDTKKRKQDLILMVKKFKFKRILKEQDIYS